MNVKSKFTSHCGEKFIKMSSFIIRLRFCNDINRGYVIYYAIWNKPIPLWLMEQKLFKSNICSLTLFVYLWIIIYYWILNSNTIRITSEWRLWLLKCNVFLLTFLQFVTWMKIISWDGSMLKESGALLFDEQNEWIRKWIRYKMKEKV